jgi:hypothetical protein
LYTINATASEVSVDNNRNESIADPFNVPSFTRVKANALRLFKFETLFPTLSPGTYKVSAILVPTAYHTLLKDELVNADGSVSTGAYDVVPILDAFVEEHPDFSYRGAKAVLALTGYNGVFGYRTHPDGRVTLGEEEYEKNVETVKTLAAALTDSGYELACYTYANSSYGAFSVSQIQTDIAKWTDEVVPIIGKTEILVFAQNSDIGSGMLYSGEKYDYLKAAGFNYFISPIVDGNPFTFISDEYVRQGRLFVSRATIKAQENWFSSIMDTEGIIDDEIRNTSAD